MTLLLEMFTYPCIVRAFAAGVLLSLCAALLGVPLVLKRYSMIGDGLSHVSFGALSVALACGWAPLPVSIPVVIVAALGLLRMTERSRMGADAAIAVVSASSLAVGVIVTSLTTRILRGAGIDLASLDERCMIVSEGCPHCTPNEKIFSTHVAARLLHAGASRFLLARTQAWRAR